MLRTYYICVTVSLWCLMFSSTSHAQFSTGHWERVGRIPMDSIIPRRLLALDSSHLLFTGYTYSNGFWGNDLPNVSTRMHWYLSSDAGYTWTLLDLTQHDFVDTCSSYFMGTEITDELCQSIDGKHIYMSTYGFKNDPIQGSYNVMRLMRSDDYGMTWQVVYSALGTSVNNVLHSAPNPNSVIITQSDSMHILRSTDRGKSFSKVIPDDTFIQTVTPGKQFGDSSKSFFRIYDSDLLNLTAIPVNSSMQLDTGKVLFNQAITSLVSSDGGVSWSAHKHEILNTESNLFCGEYQYIKGTPTLYVFPFKQTSNEITPIQYEGRKSYGWFSRLPGSAYKYYSNLADSYFNTSFLYSADYGKTWTPQHAYGKRRRGFEATQHGDVWMTVSPEDSIYFLDSKASTIVRTTDNGLTWEEDAHSLSYFEQPLDGRIISFSDPKHGWIVATHGETDCFIFRYVAEEKSSVEERWEDNPANIRQQAKVYPNPAADETTIVAPYKWNITELDIYDMMGRKLEIPLTIEGDSCTLSTRTLSSGCYLAILITHRGYKYRSRFAVVR